MSFWNPETSGLANLSIQAGEGLSFLTIFEGTRFLPAGNDKSIKIRHPLQQETKLIFLFKHSYCFCHVLKIYKHIRN